MLRKTTLPVVIMGLGSFGVLAGTTFTVKNLLSSGTVGSAFEIFASESKRDSEPTVFSSRVNDTDISANENSIAIESSTTEIPDYLLYDRMFDMAVRFKKLAEKQRSNGEDVTAFDGYFEREANLDERQGRSLHETADDYVEAVAQIDAQAEIIIEQLRRQNPGGLGSDGQIIQPSPELLRLQEQRDELAVFYRDQLSSLLGIEKFAELDAFIRGNFASGFHVIPVSPEQTSNVQGGGK